MRLYHSDFVDLAPDTEGEYVMVRHDDCDNGIDHKKRLWIKRNNDGSINAYCHNCQASGFYRDNERVETTESMQEKMKITQTNVQLPTDFKSGVDNIPPLGLVWLYRAGLTKEEVNKHGFGWSACNKRIIIPVYNGYNKLALYQGRSLDMESNPPKYLTLKNKSLPALFKLTNFDKGDIVVTEDVLSAIRCGRVKNSVSTMGVGMSDCVKAMMPTLGSRVLLFYDDDNSTVRSSTLQLKKDLDNIMKHETVIIKTNVDPKEYSDKDLRTLLEAI